MRPVAILGLLSPFLDPTPLLMQSTIPIIKKDIMRIARDVSSTINKQSKTLKKQRLKRIPGAFSGK